MKISRRLLLGSLAASSAVAQSGEVEIVVPEDGGTPRERSRIVRRGPNEFGIAASVEEGRSVLTHAVSRVDVILRNPGPAAQVTLHLDLSGEGKRTNFDTSHFGGMPLRDFVFVQGPGEVWKRVDGSTSGWVATVMINAPSGDTKVGLAPWYTYADYLRFVKSLPEHPHLKKTLIGKSDGGREHWELTITDPSWPAEKKRKIFWHAREHSYETFSSFAMQGAVEHLLSAAAVEARRKFVFTLHPMTNIDGVAQGHEYRGGYDYPEPRGTSTARLTFGAVDRLQPDFAVAWHNWTAPRDVDVVFFTDSDNGRQSRRAWDLFTQHMPSPRGVGHRWDRETDPNLHNWFGMKLSENNVHQYAMKRYGTRVWGWEIPWWNRDEGDPARNAAQLGADFARAFTTTLEKLESPVVRRAESKVEVPRWQMHEFVLRGRAHVANLFRDAALVGEFTSPSGQTTVVEGFHDGGDEWRLRFAAAEEGEWRYLLRGEGVELFEQGRVLVKPAAGHGFLRIHPKNPYAFSYSDGTDFFPMGDTCYGLYDDGTITPALRKEYLETRRRQHFNFVRISIGHSPYRAAADPAFWAWGGTAKEPDLDRLNPVFFRGFDELLLDLKSRGMNVELLLLNFYRAPFTNTKEWTASRERLWLRYVLARYGAFENIFLWTLANEYETHPDGRYRLDRDGDLNWAKATARAVKKLDPYHHPVSVHPVISSSANGSSTRDPFDPPWRIGGFFGEGDAIDVLSQQTSTAYQGMWDATLECWTGDAAGIEKSVAADRVYRKPVLNSENGYEYLRGYPTHKKQVHHTDKVRRASWRIVCAGGYVAAGFAATIGHGDHFNRMDAPNKYPFVVRDEGAAGQLATLYEFFTALPFSRLEPQPALVRGDGLGLGVPGEVHVVYAPSGGKFAVDLGAPAKTWKARWFNPRSGQFTEVGSVRSTGWQDFQAPDDSDWALLVN